MWVPVGTSIFAAAAGVLAVDEELGGAALNVESAFGWGLDCG